VRWFGKPKQPAPPVLTVISGPKPCLMCGELTERAREVKGAVIWLCLDTKQCRKQWRKAHS
jgi:hypothetical protein